MFYDHFVDRYLSDFYDFDANRELSKRSINWRQNHKNLINIGRQSGPKALFLVVPNRAADTLHLNKNPIGSQFFKSDPYTECSNVVVHLK